MKVLDVWYLEKIKDFSDRKLVVGKNSNNKSKCEVILFETRITDGQIFTTKETGFKAEKIIEREKKRILYTRQDILNSRKGKPYGWTYGDNREIHNRKGEVIAIRQYRRDYYGQKEIV